MSRRGRGRSQLGPPWSTQGRRPRPPALKSASLRGTRGLVFWWLLPTPEKGVERSHQVSLCSWFRTVQVPAETRRGQCRGPVGRRGGAAGRWAPGCPAESAARAARARSASAARVQPVFPPRADAERCLG